MIGGLPLFSSGMRIDDSCSSLCLRFAEPCDESHISHDDKGVIRCVRSGIIIGKKEGNIFTVNSRLLRFHSIDEKWPVESQPENYWGSEGQYRAWNMHEMSNKPLSY